MICAHCGKEFFEEWRKDRKSKYKPLLFCSRGCSNARNPSLNHKEAISKGLKRYYLGNPKFASAKEPKRVSSFIRKDEVTSVLHLSKRTAVKIMLRLQLPCSSCGWYVAGVSLDIHHILPIKKGGGDQHSNLTYICPNCHRLAHSDMLDASTLVPLATQIGDTWKEYYFITKHGFLKETGDNLGGGL